MCVTIYSAIFANIFMKINSKKSGLSPYYQLLLHDRLATVSFTVCKTATRPISGIIQFRQCPRNS